MSAETFKNSDENIWLRNSNIGTFYIKTIRIKRMLVNSHEHVRRKLLNSNLSTK